MSISTQYGFLLGSSVLLVVWVILFIFRKDLRKEMFVMSFIVGVLSVISGYYWWTVDWWRPLNITGTKVGIEDFLIGFGSGGIMAVAYEEIFKKYYYKRKTKDHYPGAFTVFLLLAFSTSYLFWGLKLTSFYASSIAMTVTFLFMIFYRKDLLINGLFSGLLMAVISVIFYYPITLLSSEWVEKTYLFETLSGVMVSGVPVEEFVFWFLAGLVFGPLYEYWQGERLRIARAK